ncbi:sirohydrochlorin chelatase [Pseudonocardia ailaonensis]|uniref:Sirohydrochlorin chelatase n=1 Tax=Pseudonocardia ailaonensis TaxID=367279 RepID=A0ABN2MXN6_9PSEU
MTVPLVLIAHGSRSDAADAVIRTIAEQAGAALPGVEVRVGYVDVRRPSVADAVAGLDAAVVLPAFLASGYHVRTDLPAQLAAAIGSPAGRPALVGAAGPAGARDLPASPALQERTGLPAVVRDVPASPARQERSAPPALVRDLPASSRRDRAGFVVTSALGPDPLLVRAALARLADAGHRIGDMVVLAAAGSSDPAALAEVRAAGRMLGQALGRPVRVGFAATAGPRIDTLVDALRHEGARRISVVPWLLAPGVFHTRITESGADVVGAPLGAHPHVVAAVLQRYRAAVRAVPAAA